MDNGRYCALVYTVALVAFALLVTSMSTPYQLEFVTKPFARIILSSGHLESWSAEKLDLDPDQFERVKDNYYEYLEKNRRVDDDSEGGSDDSDEDLLMGAGLGNNQSKTMAFGNLSMTGGENLAGNHSRLIETSDDSSDSDDSDDSDSEEITITERLEDQPLQRTVAIGLFSAKTCTISQEFKEMCTDTSTSEAFMLLGREIFFIDQEINTPLWNDLRVESLLSIVAWCIGMLCLVATHKPCCINHNTPIYMAAVAFAVSGLVVFVPVVRIVLISTDFKQMLESNMNITTRLGFSWSILASGLSVPFSVLVSILLVVQHWAKTKRIFHKLLSRDRTNDGEGKGGAYSFVSVDTGGLLGKEDDMK